MSTIFVWVLLVRFDPGINTSSSVVIDSIATLEECERVRKVIVATPAHVVQARCIQVQKVKP